MLVSTLLYVVHSELFLLLYPNGLQVMLRSMGFASFTQKCYYMECIVDHKTCVQYNGHINKYINNDLEVAHPQSGSLSPSFLVEVEFGSVGF